MKISLNTIKFFRQTLTFPANFAMINSEAVLCFAPAAEFFSEGKHLWSFGQPNTP
jgi:hypothetical protein